jgi:hypothetical protein
MTRILRQLGIVTIGIALTACTVGRPLHVVVDPSLAAGEVYEVSGLVNRYWGRPLAFGGFSTKKTRVGESWTWTAGIFDLGAGRRVRPYRFVFVGERGEEWKVECRARTPILRRTHDDGGYWQVALGETRLGCAMQDPTGAFVHALTVAGNGLDFGGETDFGGAPIEIRSLHRVADEGGRARRIPGVLGYELLQHDRVLASVDLLGKGRVYLARDTPAELRTPVAMTATVMMLFGES